MILFPYKKIWFYLTLGHSKHNLYQQHIGLSKIGPRSLKIRSQSWMLWESSIFWLCIYHQTQGCGREPTTKTTNVTQNVTLILKRILERYMLRLMPQNKEKWTGLETSIHVARAALKLSTSNPRVILE